MFRKLQLRHLRIITALILVLFGSLLSSSNVHSSYFVARPIQNGQIDQLYLYGETTPEISYKHRGVDFPYDTGTSVYSIADGIVVDLRESLTNDTGSSFGNYVMVRHTNRHYVRQNNLTPVGLQGYVYSIYAHLSKNSVLPTVGDAVTQGQLIALSDNTGNSTGPHFHLQIVLDQSGNRNNALDATFTENNSRNPELWLTPLYQNTARAIGMITDVNGNPLENVAVCGMQKADPEYGSSVTYTENYLNSDDIFVENFSTTDVYPGTYHLRVYSGLNCTGTVIKDLGWNTFMAGQTTFIGLYPVYLPGIRSSNSIYTDSTIVIRNNSTTDTAQVVTTIFDNFGYVNAQYTDSVSPQEMITIDPEGINTGGSAMVVGSQDISVVVLHDKQTPAESWAANTGIRTPKTEAHVPALHRNNSDWYNRIFIQNAGMGTATVTVNFYPALSGNACTQTYSISQNGLRTVETSALSCLGSTFIGSAYITSDEPIAVAWEQYKSSSAEMMISGNEGGTANTVYAPMLQNNNVNWNSGIVVQNTSSSTNSFSNFYRKPDAIQCFWDIGFFNIAPRYSGFRFPPPPQCSAYPVLTASLSGGSLPVAANINQVKTNTSFAGNYSGIASPGTIAYIPWVNETSLWTPRIHVQVIGTQTTTVSIDFYYTDGTFFTSVTTLPLSQYQMYTNIGVPNTSNFQGTAVVRANSSPQTPIAVIASELKSGETGSDLLMMFNGDHR